MPSIPGMGASEVALPKLKIGSIPTLGANAFAASPLRRIGKDCVSQEKQDHELGCELQRDEVPARRLFGRPAVLPFAAMWRLLFEAPSQPEKCEPRTMEAPMRG